MFIRCSPLGRKAFSLVEMLVVVAIISLLVAIIFPVFGTVREKGRQTTCTSNLKQIGMGMLQYSQDYDEMETYSYFCVQSNGNFEYTWSDAIYPYVRDADVFDCPDDLFVPTSGSFEEFLPPTASNPTASEYAPGSYLANSSFRNNSKASPRVGGNYGPIVTSLNGSLPVSVSQINSPSTTALVFDGAQYSPTGATWTYSTYYSYVAYDWNQEAYYPPTATQVYPMLEMCNPCAATSAGNGGATAIVARHSGFVNVAWCDGHVKAMQLTDLLKTKTGSNYPTDLIITQ